MISFLTVSLSPRLSPLAGESPVKGSDGSGPIFKEGPDPSDPFDRSASPCRQGVQVKQNPHDGQRTSDHQERHERQRMHPGQRHHLNYQSRNHEKSSPANSFFDSRMTHHFGSFQNVASASVPTS